MDTTGELLIVNCGLSVTEQPDKVFVPITDKLIFAKGVNVMAAV